MADFGDDDEEEYEEEGQDEYEKDGFVVDEEEDEEPYDEPQESSDDEREKRKRSARREGRRPTRMITICFKKRTLRDFIDLLKQYVLSRDGKTKFKRLKKAGIGGEKGSGGIGLSDDDEEDDGGGRRGRTAKEELKRSLFGEDDNMELFLGPRLRMWSRLQILEEAAGALPSSHTAIRQAAEWIYDRVFGHLAVPARRPEFEHLARYRDLIPRQIANILHFIHDDKFEIPFIAMYRREDCFGLLKEPSDDHEDKERPMIQQYGVRFLSCNVDC